MQLKGLKMFKPEEGEYGGFLDYIQNKGIHGPWAMCLMPIDGHGEIMVSISLQDLPREDWPKAAATLGLSILWMKRAKWRAESFRLIQKPGEESCLLNADALRRAMNARRRDSDE